MRGRTPAIPANAMNPQIWLYNLAAHSVQVAVLTLAGTTLLVIFRLKTPRVLLAFWQALLVLCLLLPLIQPWREARLPGASAPAVSIAGELLPAISGPIVPLGDRPDWRSRLASFPVSRTIVMVLGAGIGLRFLWLALGLLRLRHYRNKARMLSAVPETVRETCWRVGVNPEIFLSAQIDTPVTFGWKKPVVLFPESFAEMAEALQRPIACHELLHVARRDWLFIVLEEILRSLFWFHPAIWWVLSRIHLSREQVVDGEVLRVTGERGPYLESLLHIASLRGRPAAVPAPLLLKERHLVQRVTLMLKESKMTKSRVISSLAAIAALLLATGTFAAVWFPLNAPPAPAKPAAAAPAAPVFKDAAPIAAVRKDATPARQEPVRVGAKVQEGKLIYKVNPVYPEIARAARIEGTVLLEVVVDELGSVASLRVLNGTPMLDQAAIDAVKQWRYSQTLLNGQPVRVATTVSIIFSLGGFVEPTVMPLPAPPAPPPSGQEKKVEPIRVGGNVQETKLIKRVDPVYPELAKRARVEQVVMLEVTADETGAVSNVRVIKGHPVLDQAAVDAVRQWIYQPTYLNGNPVPVVATVTVIFSLTPKLTLGADGYIRDAEGAIVPMSALMENSSIQITPAPDVSFDLAQRTLSNLRAQGIDKITLFSQAYSWIGGRLFYQAPVVANSDPTIKAPVIEYDTNRVAELARASGRLPAGAAGEIGLAYTVGVDGAGKIVAIQSQSGPFAVPEIDEVIKQARVLSPGLRNGVPVPMALRITVRVQLN
jgi:TonB family protein